MNQTDQMKVCDYGFKIIRAREVHLNLLPPKTDPRIVYKAKGISEWRTFEKGFKSKAARDRRMAELLRDPKIIVE